MDDNLKDSARVVTPLGNAASVVEISPQTRRTGGLKI